MGAQALVFRTDSTERMRIISSGQVGINMTPGSDRMFMVKGSDATANNFVVTFQNTSAYLFQIRNDGAIFTGTAVNSPYNNNTTGRNVVVESGGVLGYLPSTRESKANIEFIKSVDFINKLNPVQFNYRKKDNETNEYTDELYDNINYGFIADEVEKVNKELVFYNEDGSLAGVEYNSMIAILTKAIQELQSQINELKNK